MTTVFLRIILLGDKYAVIVVQIHCSFESFECSFFVQAKSPRTFNKAFFRIRFCSNYMSLRNCTVIRVWSRQEILSKHHKATHIKDYFQGGVGFIVLFGGFRPRNNITLEFPPQPEHSKSLEASAIIHWGQVFILCHKYIYLKSCPTLCRYGSFNKKKKRRTAVTGTKKN